MTDINEALNAAPETLNTDANGTWMLKLTVTNTDEANALLAATEYEKFVAEEQGH